MSLRFAFIGFRHGHIHSLYDLVEEAGDMEVVAACEEHAPTRERLQTQGRVKITHTDYGAMLDEVACDVVATGDYFTIRGKREIQALRAGKHIISDKPLCTDLDDLEEIARLAREGDLRVGCMLTQRGLGCMIGARDLIRGGTLGEVHAISFGGQHPLNLGSRAEWYFEPGKHGGTITDIAIHAVDVIPWITGRSFARVVAARCWNALAPEYPHFEDGAQMMLTMDNGCGVLGDVSYFMPNSAGYTLPFYWRITFWGQNGVLEVGHRAEGIQVAVDGDKALSKRPEPEGRPGSYLDSFVRDLRGEASDEDLDTCAVLQSSRIAVAIQNAADANAHDVALPTTGRHRCRWA